MVVMVSKHILQLLDSDSLEEPVRKTSDFATVGAQRMTTFTPLSLGSHLQ